MYKVLFDNTLVCDSRIEELALIDPKVSLEENKAGSFSFKIPPAHPSYNAIQRKKTIVDVYRDNVLLFSGQCTKVTTDFYKQKSITCEGELSYLNDSIQRPARYQGATVRGLLEAFIANHNAQVEESKQFQVGVVTVEDSNDYISCYTNMESTLKCIKEDLVDDLGGIVRIRHKGKVRYIDYLAEAPNTSSQTIRLGENLSDFKSNIDSADIATAIIPLGAKLEESAVEGLETRLTIANINDGLDYVHNAEAVEAFGWIYKTVEFDAVTTPEALKRKGEKYLQEVQFENVVIEAKAVDLHLVDKDIEQFMLSDNIPVVSAPHGLNRHFRLTKQVLNLNSPEKDTITLGKSERVPLSAKSNQVSAEIKKLADSITPGSTILNQAIANATALITSAMGGYVVKTNNELLIMDTNDIKTAKKVWRWNINGLGYSSTGYDGEYATAITMDGKILADFIQGAVVQADSVVSRNEDGAFSMVEEGYILFGNDNTTCGAVGYGTHKGTIKASTLRTYQDLLILGQKEVGWYYINPNNAELTDKNYTENHYFKGNARVETDLVVNKLLQSNDLIVLSLMQTKDLTATGKVQAADVVANSLLQGDNLIIFSLIQAKGDVEVDGNVKSATAETGELTATNINVTGNVYAAEAGLTQAVIAGLTQTKQLIVQSYLQAKGEIIASDKITATGNITSEGDIEAANMVKGETLVCNKMGINGGVAQPIDWVWDGNLGRYVLCTVTE